MEICEQGVVVDVRCDGQVFMMAQSRSSNGLLGGHGKYKKLKIFDAEDVLGSTIRACLNDRNPGFYAPHMYKEKEAFEAKRAAYLEDRGIKSDRTFFKGTKSFAVSEYTDRIEFIAADNTKPGRGSPWVKGGPHVVVAPNASDVELGQAMRKVLEFCLA